MSVASKTEIGAGRLPRRRHATGSRSRGAAAQHQAALGLVPFVTRYRGRAVAALIALTVAAVATLAVPIAVRRMIDNGFDPTRAGLIDEYFGVMILVVAVLAGASAMRYYLVTTIGERVVADLRDAVFDRITTLSAAFFDTAKSGELVSRLTADTTQIKSAVGASVSIALRNLVLFFGSAAMMVVTSPRLSAFVLGRHPGDRAAAGRVRPHGAQALARRPGHARRCLRLRVRADRRGAHAAGLHQREAGAAAISPRRSSAPMRRRSIRSGRAPC